MNLDTAVVYDTETFPNCFTLQAVALNNEVSRVWEISEFKDERKELIAWFNYLHQTQTFMLGFNNIGFDFPIVDYIFNNPHVTVEQIYAFAMDIINSKSRFGKTIWADKRFAPQIDLFKMYHFNNKAKSTSLKALEINMRSPNVMDMPVPLGTNLTRDQIDNYLIPYGINDANETKKLALLSHKAMNFRLGLVDQFGIDVLNYPDSKIGEQMMIQKLGKNLCYSYNDENKRVPRQSVRTRIALNDVIFPYIHFTTDGFNNVLNYLRQQVLGVKDIEALVWGDTPTIETKGVFKGLKATYQGVDFHFGTGGLHGSLNSVKAVSTDQFQIRDIDVKSLYPSIAIVNHMGPEHLGETFSKCYKELPEERVKWQAEKGKKCVEANALKLASNSVYGNSNNKYSVFFDTLHTMKTTVNGQLMLCMLIERLVEVPTLQLIQANTDGITYYIDKDQEHLAAKTCKEWEAYTLLILEDVDYKRMWIRDVNNYIAEDMDGNLKLKGAYWYPDPNNYDSDISEQQPPAWHKDLSALVCIRAAVEYMVNGIDIEQYIRMTFDPYDFMCRIKTKRSDHLFWNDIGQQRTSRYFMSVKGSHMHKIAPPNAKYKSGAFKKKNGVDEFTYNSVMTENNWQWIEEVCTKNKSVYETRKTAIQAGNLTTMCNNVEDFDFKNINYAWYVEQSQKLVIT